jgi:hypothetical protein
MDAVVAGAITAIGLPDRSQRETWFDTLCTTYRDGTPDWAQFAQQLETDASAAGIPDDSVRVFIEYLNAYASSPMDVVAEMAEIGTQLPNSYDELTTETAEPQAEEATAYGYPQLSEDDSGEWVEATLDPEQFPLTYELATLTDEAAVRDFLLRRGIDLDVIVAYREAIAPAKPELSGVV